MRFFFLVFLFFLLLEIRNHLSLDNGNNKITKSVSFVFVSAFYFKRFKSNISRLIFADTHIVFMMFVMISEREPAAWIYCYKDLITTAV